MRFGVLGPLLALADDGDPVALDAPKPRLTLATLLVHAPQPVSLDRMIDVLWDANPPRHAVASAHNVIARLRTAFGPAGRQRIRTTGAGYIIDLEGARLDLSDFHNSYESGLDAYRTGRWSEAQERLTAGLALWRGPFLADLPSVALAADTTRWTELRLHATEMRIDAAHGLARYEETVADLRRLVSDHPMRGRFAEQLMLALHELGRAHEALQVYRDTYRRMADELGIEPSAELQRLHRLVLGAKTPTPTTASRGPRELPAPTHLFTGRRSDLAELAAVLDGPVPAGMLLIVGPAGIGKSTLAAEFGVSVADRFPDGQVWMDVQGHHPQTALPALTILRRVLQSLGVPAGSMPADLDSAAALLRTVTADRRVLIVLDNVAESAHLPHLQPAPGSLLVVTSRFRLTDAVVRHGARRHTLAGLEEDDAVALLARIVGADRIAADPDDARDLALACDRLPLALCITGAHLAERDHRTLADQVRAIGGGALLREGADPGDDSPVRAVFDESYAALDPEPRRLFHLLGLHPGPALEPHAAAMALRQDRPTVAALAAHLRQMHLITETGRGWYRMHDLLRAYAGDRARTSDPAAAVDMTERLHRHYTQAAWRAVIAAGQQPNEYEEPTDPGATTLEFPDAGSAHEWLEYEIQPIRSMAAGADESDRFAIAAGSIVSRWLMSFAHFTTATEMFDRLIRTARSQGNAQSTARGLRLLGTVCWHHGDDRAVQFMQEALDILLAEGIQVGLGQTYNNLGAVLLRRADLDGALRCFAQAVAAYERDGNAPSTVRTLSNIGVTCHSLGRYQEALVHYERALEILVTIDDPIQTAHTRSNIGNLYFIWGDYQKARELHEEAMPVLLTREQAGAHLTTAAELARALVELDEYHSATKLINELLPIATRLNSRPILANVHTIKGRMHFRSGELEEARREYEAGARMGVEIGDPDRESVGYLGLAETALAQGRHEQARDRAEQAGAIAERVNLPLIRARAIEVLGRVHLATGEVVRGRALRTEARVALTALGALRA